MLNITIIFEFAPGDTASAEMLSKIFHDLRMMESEQKSHWETIAPYALTDWAEGNLTEEDVTNLYLKCVKKRFLRPHVLGRMPFKATFFFAPAE
jgi:hypothetical protein